MKQHYFPKLSDEAIREILSRGGDQFWTRLRQAAATIREYLAGWMLSGLIDWETGTMEDAARPPRRPTACTASDMVDETLSWLVARRPAGQGERGAADRGRCMPVGTVDPDYVDFWQLVAEILQQLAERRCPPPPPRRGAARRPAVPLHRPARRPGRRAPAPIACPTATGRNAAPQIAADRVSRELLKMRGN